MSVVTASTRNGANVLLAAILGVVGLATEVLVQPARRSLSKRRQCRASSR